MHSIQDDQQKLRRLHSLLVRTRGKQLRQMGEKDLRELPRLYRFASSLFARLETTGANPATLDATRDLLRRAHAVLYRGAGAVNQPWYRRLFNLFAVHSPRALRAEWKMLVFSMTFFYGVATAAFLAVSQQLELAYTLFDPGAVATEIAQLDATEPGEAFRGNFTFETGKSAGVAGYLIAHNTGIAILLFAAGLTFPFFVYLLLTNALMLGVYTAVASHWGQAGAISSILWCHGVLEIQAIILAGLGGTILLRAWIAPGPWTRKHAMKLEMPRALHVLAPAFPMLITAGLIEGYISPHAPTTVRMGVAVLTGVALLAWLLLSGRQVRKS